MLCVFDRTLPAFLSMLRPWVALHRVFVARPHAQRGIPS
jgi:hypothetical protein